MSEPLLLPSTKTLVVHRSRPKRYLRTVAIVVGIIVVLVGLADVSSRLASSALGEDAAFDIFAPAAALDVQNSQNSVAEPVPLRLKIPVLGVDVPVEEAGRIEGLAGLQEGDYLTVITTEKAQVYSVRSVTVYYAGAPQDLLPEFLPERLVLLSVERDVAVVAYPAYR